MISFFNKNSFFKGMTKVYIEKSPDATYPYISAKKIVPLVVRGFCKMLGYFSISFILKQSVLLRLGITAVEKFSEKLKSFLPLINVLRLA